MKRGDEMKRGDWVVYENGYKREIGRVVSITNNGDSAFVCYSHGCTAARTSMKHLHAYDEYIDTDLKPDKEIGFNRFADSCSNFDCECCYSDCVAKFGNRRDK